MTRRWSLNAKTFAQTEMMFASMNPNRVGGLWNRFGKLRIAESQA